MESTNYPQPYSSIGIELLHAGQIWMDWVMVYQKSNLYRIRFNNLI